MTPEELAKCKARGGASPKVITVHGLRPEGFQVLAPSTMQYRSKTRTQAIGEHECAGCIFRHQSAAVCAEAARLAVLAGSGDCDDGNIYARVTLDPRQLEIGE